MNPDEYDQIAESLQKQLNQKESLLEFHVPNALEYSLNYHGFHNDEPINTFVVEWRVRINKRSLTGASRLTKEFIDTLTLDVAEYIIENSVQSIAQAIAHPDKISEAKIVIT